MTTKEIVIKSPIRPSMAKAIREHCLQCGDGTSMELRDCHLIDCPLFPYRFGANPASAIKKLQKTYTVKVIE